MCREGPAQRSQQRGYHRHYRVTDVIETNCRGYPELWTNPLAPFVQETATRQAPSAPAPVPGFEVPSLGSALAIGRWVDHINGGCETLRDRYTGGIRWKPKHALT